MTNGFVGSKTDPSLFIHSLGSTNLFTLVYIDDIIIWENSLPYVMRVIHALSFEFALKDLGPLHYCLSIKVIPSWDGSLLSQPKYILELIQRASLSDAKPVLTPLSPSMTLSTSLGSLFSVPTKYHSALQYVTLTRPNLAFTVNKACQFMHQPTNAHWSAIKLFFQYLRGTHAHGFYPCSESPFSLEAFCDADWADCLDNRSPLVALLFFLGPIWFPEVLVNSVPFLVPQWRWNTKPSLTLLMNSPLAPISISGTSTFGPHSFDPRVR